MRAVALATTLLVPAAVTAVPAQVPGSIRAVDPARFDTTCAPCTDFFRYANGGWEARTEIPPQYTSYGVEREIQDRTEEVLRKILEDAARDAPRNADSTTRLLGMFYGSCMDSVRARREGAAPLQPPLRRIATIRTRGDLAEVLGELQRQGVDVGVATFAYPDLAHRDTLRLNLYQGSHGLPDRDYYLRPDSAFATARRDYRAHAVRMFRLLGETPAAARQDAERVWRLEHTLARAALAPEEAANLPELHHPVSRRALDSLAPNVDWTRYLAALGVPRATQVNVMVPGELAALDSLVAAAPLADWRGYLLWSVASFAAPFLGPRFEAEHLAHHRIVGKANQLEPLWQRCLYAADEHIGEALGRAYVRVAFPAGAKSRMLGLAANLRTALRHRLERVGWMSNTTRAVALARLDSMTSKIGYPDRWRDYSQLVIRPGSFLPNVLAAQRFEVDRQNARIDGLVDRGEWTESPPTYDAYYDPSNNEIVFPAGILQPPLFDPAADDAVNYGAIGFLIGHELLHAYVPVDTIHIDGRLTLRENLADIGGLMVAYDAWRLSLQGKPAPAPIDGFTPEQRFFLAFANSWREKTRLEAQRTDVASTTHSPERSRVNGVVPHLEVFAKAFGCREGDPMVRPTAERLHW